MKRTLLLSTLIATLSFTASAQEVTTADTTHYQPQKPLKLHHAEPLYIDLIRDLGAHKGEKEWNIGAGMTDNLGYDRYNFLVEYEWAPIDRLGLEIEVPVSVYTTNSKDRRPEVNRPSDRIESLKLAAQYTFLVNERSNTSMALGTITEFELTELDRIRRDDMFQGFLFNPFVVAAKKWGSNFHSLIYTGPRVFNHFGHSGLETSYEINTSAHYMIPNSRNFVGLEVNKEMQGGHMDMVLRPQMRLVINEGLMIGIVTGIPVTKERERMSTFLRLIYEPGHKKY
ncbi:phosphoribosylformylglycinamidine synthase [Pontibacter sp. FD36]|uniref:HAEPLYID family protein n=1 Tax=Pontibacter sp. FD36 TaxID=2789860 RepID=UPI0018A9F7DC|nr:HAEPLYID family protein [Pontibacter sp. FD36]MBF8964646.1 phosphoribosylformylglycinamidine synthase [Pontibacter sp. FD36]